MKKILFSLMLGAVLTTGLGGCLNPAGLMAEGKADSVKVDVQLADSPRPAVPVSAIKFIDRREVAKAMLGDEKNFEEVGPGLIAKYRAKFLKGDDALATLTATVTGTNNPNMLTKEIYDAIEKKTAKLGGTIFLVENVRWDVHSHTDTIFSGKPTRGVIYGEVLVSKK